MEEATYIEEEGSVKLPRSWIVWEINFDGLILESHCLEADDSELF